MRAFGGNSSIHKIMRWPAAAVLLFSMIAMPSKSTAQLQNTATTETVTESARRFDHASQADDLFGDRGLTNGKLVLSSDAMENVKRTNLLLQQGGGMDSRIDFLLLYPTLRKPTQYNSDGVSYVSDAALERIDLNTVFQKKIKIVPTGEGAREVVLLSPKGRKLVVVKGDESPLAGYFGGQIDLDDKIHLTGRMELTERVFSVFHHQDVELVLIPVYGGRITISPLLSNTIRYSDLYGAAVSMELGTMLKVHVEGYKKPLFLTLSGGPEILFTGKVGTAFNILFSIPL